MFLFFLWLLCCVRCESNSKLPYFTNDFSKLCSLCCKARVIDDWTTQVVRDTSFCGVMGPYSHQVIESAVQSSVPWSRQKQSKPTTTKGATDEMCLVGLDRGFQSTPTNSHPLFFIFEVLRLKNREYSKWD